jgi:uridine phosphorylase
MTDRTQIESTAELGDQSLFAILKDLDMPRYVLLPGNPDRVQLMADQWTDSIVVDMSRGYRAAAGTPPIVEVASVRYTPIPATQMLVFNLI